MTNDELNYWLCLWYHQEILGECVHKMERRGQFGWTNKYYCKKCKRTFIGPQNPFIPDYLSDPAVMWGIIKELFNAGWDITYTETDGAILDPPDCVAPIEDVIMDESLERAAMLALKAKHESEGEK